MPRYFLELAYKGKGYSGFQIQENANTIQSEVQKAFFTYYRKPVLLTGSSRTDAGVNAFQNFFHFDWDEEFDLNNLYNLNSLLPATIVLKSVKQVKPDSHSRFHATSRLYHYKIYSKKNPFFFENAWYYPYRFDPDLLDWAADIIKGSRSFYSFSKRNIQVKTYECIIYKTEWVKSEDDLLVYKVEANRFLRGMVRGLVGTMMSLARNQITVNDFQELLKGKVSAGADFSAPAHGLYLVEVKYPNTIFI